MIVFLLSAALTAPWLVTDSMVERLARVSSSANPRTNAFLNRQRVEMLARYAKTLKDPGRQFKAKHDAADERVKSGDAAGGIVELEGLLALLHDSLAKPPLVVELAVRESLAVACLRLGEQENCVDHHGADSCIFPISGSGLHARPQGSRKAVEHLTWLVEKQPAKPRYRWLLNLACMTLGDYPDAVPAEAAIPPDLFASVYDVGRFHDVASAVGLDTVGLAGGANLDDFNGDGWLDAFVTSWGLADPCHLLINRGNGTFEDRTSAWGLDGIVGGLNTSHADYDNDGDLDILVLRGAWLMKSGRHPNSLLRNDGGRFTDVTIESGLFCEHPCQAGEWGDFDRDGDLDLFIGNESSKNEIHPCQLFENQGDGTFRDIASEVGLAHVAFVKGASWGDYDNDGDLDIYLSSMASKNALYENLGRDATSKKWKFRDVTALAGVAEPSTSFATWFWDYDNDGWEDLLVCSFGSFTQNMLDDVAADYLKKPHRDECFRLYRNLGTKKFAEVSDRVGLRRATMAMGANFGDIDNDGYLDLYVGTGQPDLGTLVPNRMFRNAGAARFQDVTTSGGFGHLQKGHGVAFGDVDHDGDQDVFIVMGGAYDGDVYMNVLFENPGHGNQWITLELRGTQSNRSAIGARVAVEFDTQAGRRVVHRTVNTGGSFGCSTLRQEIGLGDATGVATVRVRWPAGVEQTFDTIEMNRHYQLVEGDPAAKKLVRPKAQLGGKAESRPASRPK